MLPGLLRKLTLGMVLLSGAVYAQSLKLASELTGLLNQPLLRLPVVIQYQSTPGPLDLLKLNLLGGVVNHQYSLIPAVSANLSISGILSLLLEPGITFITPDRTIAGTLDTANQAVNSAAAAQYGLDGTGVGVAILDSGIYPHSDLLSASGNSSRVVYRQSFIGGTAQDDYGHGTHVAGIVGGNGKASGAAHTFHGIAPGVNLIDLRVLNESGGSTDSIVIAGIERAVQLKSTYNI